MAIIDQEIVIYRGSRVDLEFTMDPPANILGWTIQLTVAKAQGKEKQYKLTRFIKVPTSKLLSIDAEITDAAGGEFKVSLETADTEDLDPDVYEYDLWRIDSGIETPLALGKFVLGGVVRLPAP